MSKTVKPTELETFFHGKATIGGKPSPVVYDKKPGMPPSDFNTILGKTSPNELITNKVATKKLVVVETPYASENVALLQRHIVYAKLCLSDSLKRGEAPLVSSLLYPQVLDDRIKLDHDLAMLCSLSWIRGCDMVVVYIDYGITPGMQIAINTAKIKTVKIEYRQLGKIAG